MERPEQDSQILLNHLPIEVWDLVAKASNPADVTNLTLASPVFRNLLLRQRTEFLFPEVWKVVGMQFEKEVLQEAHNNVERNGVGNWVTSVSPIRSLRVVCKTWCQEVDAFYENAPGNGRHYLTMEGQIPPYDRNPDHLEYFARRSKVGSWNQCDFSLFNARRFLDFFKRTHFDAGNDRNPLIGRSIGLSYSSNVESALINCSLLQRLKNHVHFSHLRFSDNHPSRVLLYRQLEHALEMFLNLKTAKLTYSQGVHPLGVAPPLTEQERLDLEQEVAFRPLPQLPRLEFLCLQYFPTPIFNALLAANNHVTMLEICQMPQGRNVQPGYDIYTRAMPNLKQLSIQFFMAEDFEKLKNSAVDWRLEKLNLDLNRCRFIRWSEIFSVVESKWAATLTNLALSFPRFCRDNLRIEYKSQIIEDSLSCRLNLPQVKRKRRRTYSVWILFCQ